MEYLNDGNFIMTVYFSIIGLFWMAYAVVRKVRVIVNKTIGAVSPPYNIEDIGAFYSGTYIFGTFMLMMFLGACYLAMFALIGIWSMEGTIGYAMIFLIVSCMLSWGYGARDNRKREQLKTLKETEV